MQAVAAVAPRIQGLAALPWVRRVSHNGCGTCHSICVYAPQNGRLPIQEYINLDFGYSIGFRDGTLTANAHKYPHGMDQVWLGKQIGDMGLKFGMYSDAGTTQCFSHVYGEGVNDGSLGQE